MRKDKKKKLLIKPTQSIIIEKTIEAYNEVGMLTRLSWKLKRYFAFIKRNADKNENQIIR